MFKKHDAKTCWACALNKRFANFLRRWADWMDN